MKLHDHLSKINLEEAIEKIREQSVDEDDYEEILISENREAFSDILDEDAISDEVPQVLVLKDFPLNDWDSIVLSDASKFGDSMWDFTSYPYVSRHQVLVNFDYENMVGVNLTDPMYKRRFNNSAETHSSQ